MQKSLLLFLLFVAVLPVHAMEKTTVAQLEQKLTAAHGKQDKDLAKKLGGLELTERLNSQRLASIQAGLPGDKSRQALLAIADASAFLQLPAAEIPATPPPDALTQKQMLARAASDLVASVHKLPDFFARQTTTRFHDLKISFPASQPVVLEHQAFYPLDSFSDTIYYRNGKEEVESAEKQSKTKTRTSKGLVNWGVFGPMLRMVVLDIYKGKMEWSHWEQLSTGPVAVFHFAVPKERSHYVVEYCCLGLTNEPWHEFESTPPFHGEIALDPATGAVYRLMLSTDLQPTDPIFRADVMVEYEPVEIGGKVYVCPRKSVTITTAISPIVHQSRCGNGDCAAPYVEKPKDTAINDMVFDSYHVFRSEARILTEGSAGQDDLPAPVPPVAPGP
jgi:hypothetical protein